MAVKSVHNKKYINVDIVEICHMPTGIPCVLIEELDDDFVIDVKYGLIIRLGPIGILEDSRVNVFYLETLQHSIGKMKHDQKVRFLREDEEFVITINGEKE